MWIVLLDQFDFPTAGPALQLLLARDGGMNVTVNFIVDEAMNAVSRCEAFDKTLAMLVDATHEVGSSHRCTAFRGPRLQECRRNTAPLDPADN